MGGRHQREHCNEAPAVIFLACILALMTYLTLTKKDQTPPERS